MRDHLGLDDDWRRPLPSNWWRSDVVVAGIILTGALLGLEVMRALGAPAHMWGRPALYLSTFAGVLPLVWRRRFPLTVMVVLAAHMFVLGTTQSIVMANMAMQVAYFFSIFTAVAWGADRRVTVLVTGGVLLFMFGWVALQLSVASMRDDLVSTYSNSHGSTHGALFGPATASILYTVMINLVFFVTAVTTGANSWSGARARARAEEQALTIAEQSARLTSQAVVRERLRIARELHDVVAHHVSAMGVQAAAARKLLSRHPEAAQEALTNVESSSREAVAEMRSLLGTLRVGEATGSLPDAAGVPIAPDVSPDVEGRPRVPEPGLDDLPALVGQARSGPLDVEYAQVFRAGADVPAAVGHSIYRTVQEALANVRRHSTATRVSVTIRTGEEGSRRYVEAEVLDDGRPRAGTSGSGLGLLGMRERVRAHHGSADIGPRLTGGYRVRVRLPLDHASPPLEETR